MNVYRPWGPIDWLMDRLVGRQWSFVACCGTELRSVALGNYLGRKNFEMARIMVIRDPEPLNSAALCKRLDQHAKHFRNAGFHPNELRDAELLAGLDEIRAPVTDLANAGAKHIIIDVTSFPKMWFFPIVQAALEDARFEDVIVTYTSAEGYADLLSENLAPLRTLPGFYADDGRTRHQSIIVGIGFEPLALVSLLSDQKSDKIRLIFPFPPGPPGHRRNWMFVKQIEELTQSERIEPPDRVHIHMYDCPQVFDALCDMTDNGRQTSAIAPYGPKTVSLAMCLFSLAATAAGRPRVPVYYAQPLRYALDYTAGVRMREEVPEITGYCLRLNGRDLYTLTA